MNWNIKKKNIEITSRFSELGKVLLVYPAVEL